MVKIVRRNNIIPLNFDDEFTIEFVANDKTIEKLLETQKWLADQEEKISSLTEESIREYTPIVQEAVDRVFGNGVFEKVYAFAYESTADAILYFYEGMNAISEEYQKRFKNEKVTKFLNNHV